MTYRNRMHKIFGIVSLLFAVCALSFACLLGAPVAKAAESDSFGTAESANVTNNTDAAVDSVKREHLLCYEPEKQSLVCEEDRLRQLISEAGKTPTTIELGVSETFLSKTLTVEENQNIELINAAVWDGAPSFLSRADGFTGTLLHVKSGATLVLSSQGSGAIKINGRGKDVPQARSSIAKVNGALVMNAGTITGAHNMEDTYQGAVTLAGESAYFELNGGEVTRNSRANGAQYGAANVAVSQGARMVMNSGKITQGSTQFDDAAYGEVGGIGVFTGGSLQLNGGAIADNEGFAGGINAWAWDWDLADHPEKAESQRAHVTISGGEITRNKAAFGGGGISIFGNADVTMDGGIISRNTAPSGGGVNAMDLYVWGAGGSWAEVPGDGKNSGLTAAEWKEISPAAFTMNGGTIDSNTATRTGGGVNVVSNAATLAGGNITNNLAHQQGGGVYVATATYSVQLENAAVFENKASYVGGGMWLCPTGSTQINVTSGGAIFDNTATKYGDDFAHDNYGSAGAYESYFANRTLALGDIVYYLDGGVGHERFDSQNPGREQVYQPSRLNPAPVKDPNKDYHTKLFQDGLKSVISDADKTAARDAAQLLITGNESYRGGGIGSNGGVVFGYQDTELPVHKVWKDEQGKELAENLPESIELQLVLLNDAGSEKIGAPVTVTPQEDGSWSYVFSSLPTVYKGQKVEFSVLEVPVAGFTSTVEKDKNGVVLLTNTKNPEPVPPTPPSPPTPSIPPEPPVPSLVEPVTPADRVTPEPESALPQSGSAYGGVLALASVLSILLGGAMLVMRKITH